jgi:hypothetical protein
MDREEQGPRVSTEGPEDRHHDDAPIVPPSKGGSPRSPRSRAARPSRVSRSASPSDSPQSVAARVAAILDSEPEEQGVPYAVREVHRVRSAARAILEAHLPASDEGDLLAELVSVTYAAQLGDWCRDALPAELHEPEPPGRLFAGYVRVQERLRRAGYERCPTCLNGLAGPNELDALKRHLEDALRAREAWEGAAR